MKEDTCLNFNAQPETIQHFFMHCPKVKDIWLELKPPDQSFFQMDFQKWLKDKSCSKVSPGSHKISWNYIFLMALWKIWITINSSILPSDRILQDPLISINDAAGEVFAVHPPKQLPNTQTILFWSRKFMKTQHGWICPCFCRSWRPQP